MASTFLSSFARGARGRRPPRPVDSFGPEILVRLGSHRQRDSLRRDSESSCEVRCSHGGLWMKTGIIRFRPVPRPPPPYRGRWGAVAPALHVTHSRRAALLLELVVSDSIPGAVVLAGSERCTHLRTRARSRSATATATSERDWSCASSLNLGLRPGETCSRSATSTYPREFVSLARMSGGPRTAARSCH
jgi:hypothetical protein